MLIPDLASYGIQEVTVNSPADRAGLQPGDMIVSINGLYINDESVLVNAIQSSGGHLVLGVIRDGTEEPVMIEVLLDRVSVIST
jgi:S1-C subfamily serine protease